MRSRLLDGGQERMLIYPEVTVTNARDEPWRGPSDTPVSIRVTTSTDRSQDAEVPGQIAIEVLRVLTRYAPAGTWSKVVYRGEEWDVAAPPRQTPGVSKATRHTEFTIRSRNQPAIP